MKKPVQKRWLLAGAASFLLVGSVLLGRPIEQSAALRAATAYIARSPAFRARSPARDEAGTRIAKVSVIRGDNRSGAVLAYAIRLWPSGFLIFTADDRLRPVFGYSVSRPLDLSDLPENPLPAFLKNELRKRLTAIAGSEKTRGRVSVASARRAWHELLTPLRDRDARDWTTDVGPLLSTVWGQDYDTEHMSNTGNPTFNYYTPELLKSGNLVHAYSGCVAAAMAQIMKYYEWPASGEGSHSYAWDNPDSGLTETLSSDFSAHTYAWTSMKDDYYRPWNQAEQTSTEAEREAVGRLVYDCGIGAEADFQVTGIGTTAFVNTAADAMRKYFHYADIQHPSAVYGVSAPAMLEDIRGNVLGNLPVLTALTAISHVVVVDGLRQEQGSSDYEYHLNFGYQGRNNGWYDLSAFYTTDQGDGSIADDDGAWPPYDGNYYGTVSECLVDILPRVTLDDPGASGGGSYVLNWQYPTRPIVQAFELQEASPVSSTRRGDYSLGEDPGPLWAVEGNWQSMMVAGKPSTVWWGRPSDNTLGRTETLQYARFMLLHTGCRLEFDCARSNFWGLQSRVEISVDDGVSWQAVSTTNGPVAGGAIQPETQLTWQHESIPLDQFRGHDGETALVRFAVTVVGGNLISQHIGGTIPYCGWYLDQIAVTGVEVYAWTTISDSLTTESHAFTGRNLGLYFYRVRPRLLDQWRSWSNRVDYEVVPVPEYTLTLESGTGGSTVPDPGAYTVDRGTVLHLIATADEHHEFSLWTESGTGATWPDNPLDYEVTHDATLTAMFTPKQYTLTVESDFGSPDPAVGSQMFDYGQELTPTCTGSPHVDGPNTRHVLVGWSLTTPGGTTSGTGGALAGFIFRGNSTLTWHWRAEHTVAVGVGGPGTASILGGDGAPVASPAWVVEQGRATVRAVPDVGAAFTGWTGDVPATVDPRHHQMILPVPGPIELVANFASLEDTDGDGLHDPWELAYWGAIDDVDATPDANPDGDLFSNAEEYDRGTDPLVPTSRIGLGWNLIAVSRTPNAGDTLADQLSGLAHPVVWRWDAAEKTYVRVTSGAGARADGVLAPTAGYWVYSRETLFVEIPGADWGNGHVDLAAGWNLVGPIHGGPLSTLSIQSRFLWWWDGVRYTHAPDPLASACGYWVWCAGPTSVDLP